MKLLKEPFQIECRAVNFEHSCCYKDEGEPPHSDSLLNSIEQIIRVTENLKFLATITSPANSYQMNLDFDNAWCSSMKTTGKWKGVPFDAKSLRDTPNIRPDFLLSNWSAVIAIEIEKSNEKTIWFDLIKLMMLINRGIVQFGLVVAPRNYAHKTGVWNLFDRARFYKYCLYKFASVDIDLIKNIAILGYTQQAKIPDGWIQLNKDVITHIKRQADIYFSA